MSRAVPALLLLLGLAAAVWGLAVTVPHVGEAQVGYLAKSLYPVLMWSIVAVACVAGLVVVARRR